MEKGIIFTGNHLGGGITAYTNIFKNILQNKKIQVSKKLKKNSLNIIIENFSKKNFDHFKNFAKSNKGKTCLVLTEFYNEKANTFNSFEYNSYLSRYLIFFFRFINLRYIINFLFIISLGINLILIYFFYSNLLIFFLVPLIVFQFLILKKILNQNSKLNSSRKKKKIFSKNFLIQIYLNIKKADYFKKRYYYADKLINHFDIVFTSHPEIYKSFRSRHPKVFLITPVIKKINFNKELNKKNYFKFSGALTYYRYSLFMKFFSQIQKIVDKDLKYFELFFKNLKKENFDSFVHVDFKKKFNYSLHPKRDSSWKFSSPVRYFHSLSHGEIPIIFDNFNDFYSKNLSYRVKIDKPKQFINLHKKHNDIIKIMKNKIKVYNKHAKINNKKILKELNSTK